MGLILTLIGWKFEQGVHRWGQGLERRLSEGRHGGRLLLGEPRGWILVDRGREGRALIAAQEEGA